MSESLMNRGFGKVHLHHSNRFESLVERLGDVLDLPPASPFARDIIIVPSRAMERWVSLELARRFGIWANPSFPSPHAWISTLGRDLLGAHERRRTYSGAHLAWSVASSLPRLIAHEAFAPIRNYLEDDHDGTKRLALSSRIAKTFETYTQHRPDLLFAWEAALPKDDWQAVLWSAVVEKLGTEHGAARIQSLLRSVETSPPNVLPERLCVFGLQGMDPAGELDAVLHQEDRHVAVDQGQFIPLMFGRPVPFYSACCYTRIAPQMASWSPVTLRAVRRACPSPNSRASPAGLTMHHANDRRYTS